MRDLIRVALLVAFPFFARTKPEAEQLTTF